MSPKESEREGESNWGDIGKKEEITEGENDSFLLISAISNMRTWFRKALRHSLISAPVKVCDKENKLPRCNRECLDPCTCHNIHHCQRGPVYYEMHKSLICGGHKGFLYCEIMRTTVAGIAECFMEITAACCSFSCKWWHVSVDHSVRILTERWVEVPVVNRISWESNVVIVVFFVACFPSASFLCIFFSSVSEGIYPMSECVNMCLYGPC